MLSINRLRGLALAAAIAALPSLAPAAETSVLSTDAGRFTLSPVDGGQMRLDTATGAVALCAKRGNDWACRAVPDERTALQNEIDRLAAANDALAARVAELERQVDAARTGPVPVPPADVPRPQTPPPRADGPATRDLPTDADIDRAMAMVEKVFRRFMSMIEGLKPGSAPPPAPPGKT